jgi:hypothetical protein
MPDRSPVQSPSILLKQTRDSQESLGRVSDFAHWQKVPDLGPTIVFRRLCCYACFVRWTLSRASSARARSWVRLPADPPRRRAHAPSFGFGPGRESMRERRCAATSLLRVPTERDCPGSGAGNHTRDRALFRRLQRAALSRRFAIGSQPCLVPADDASGTIGIWAAPLRKRGGRAFRWKRCPGAPFRLS